MFLFLSLHIPQKLFHAYHDRMHTKRTPVFPHAMCREPEQSVESQ